MKSNKSFFWIVAAVLIIILGGLGAYLSLRPKYPNTHTTTIFIHGYASSYHAEQQMANYLVSHGASNSVARFDVSENGHVKMVGSLKQHAKNPIVEMNYNSRNPRRDMKHYDHWVVNVVKLAQKQSGYKRINLVGHSMGSMLVGQYVNLHAHDRNLPKLEHTVFLAGGLFPGFKQQMAGNINHQIIKDLRVLNVYSDKAHGTDTRVPNKYSRALRSVFGSAKEYRQVELKGLTHSQIHESTQVDRILIQFLFGRR